MLSHRLGAAEDGLCASRGGVEVIVRAAEEAEVLVEAALERMELRLVAEMRFAEPAGGVAGGLEAVADGCFLERQAEALAGRLRAGPGLNSCPKRCW